MMCFLSCFHHEVEVKGLTLLHCKSTQYINLFWLYLLPQLHRKDEKLSEENWQYLFGKYMTCRCVIVFHDLKTSCQWSRSDLLHKNVLCQLQQKGCPWGSDAKRVEERKVPIGALVAQPWEPGGCDLLLPNLEPFTLCNSQCSGLPSSSLQLISATVMGLFHDYLHGASVHLERMVEHCVNSLCCLPFVPFWQKSSDHAFTQVHLGNRALSF